MCLNAQVDVSDFREVKTLEVYTKYNAMTW